ncbi:MAG: M20/M25/M40 family metallo-hydrolase, partial [Synergistaceae bacterium]
MQRSFANLEELLTHTVFNNFAAISKIPRPSFHEEKISEYLYDWASARDLDVVRDAANNIFIRKPASEGLEDAPAVLLQAHMDMVCVKSADSDHDFSKDPIALVLDGDILSTGGKTTLGADDGIGMAYALSVLDSDTLKHPPLEVLFTTSEEEDMGGALKFDTSLLKSKYLINLDHAVDSEILTGSCGGVGVKT